MVAKKKVKCTKRCPHCGGKMRKVKGTWGHVGHHQGQVH